MTRNPSLAVRNLHLDYVLMGKVFATIFSLNPGD